jgi:4-hydroxy-tetrahydrodipicolinate synthase
MLMAAINSEAELAAEIDLKLTGLHNDLFIQSNPIPVKWAVAEMGLMGKGIRLPLTWLSPECEATVRQAMQQAGVITA